MSSLYSSPRCSAPQFLRLLYPSKLVQFELREFASSVNFSAVTQNVQTGMNWQIRLPTEWEWQQAATGGNSDNIYPWGAEWDGQRANTQEAGANATTAVGMYPHGAALCGALDMCGNICEWCLNEYDNIHCVDAISKAQHVRRGGSCNHNKEMARNDYRYDLDSFKSRYQIKDDFGFRVVLAPPL